MTAYVKHNLFLRAWSAVLIAEPGPPVMISISARVTIWEQTMDGRTDGWTPPIDEWTLIDGQISPDTLHTIHSVVSLYFKSQILDPYGLECNSRREGRVWTVCVRALLCFCKTWPCSMICITLISILVDANIFHLNFDISTFSMY